MSATLVPPATAAWNPAKPALCGDAAIAATRATTFLRGQAQWLQRGLANATDAVLVDVVMAAHDRSHERWVAVICTVEQALGLEASRAVSGVYTYMGRVAGSLDAGAVNLLPSDIADDVRAMQSERLVEITEQAVEVLWRVAAES